MAETISIADKLLEKAEEAPVLFLRFENKVALYGDDRVYCFVEGYDMAYLSSRISDLFNDKWDSIQCNGKKNLLEVYSYLKGMHTYDRYAKRFFVDADFDRNEDLGDDIYVTVCYSIENLYVSISCIEKILKTEYGIDEIENPDKFKKCMDLFCIRLKEMHYAILLFNAWYAALHDMDGWNHRGVCLDNKFPSKFIKYDFSNKIEAQYTIDDIRAEYPDVPEIDKELLEKRRLWLAEDPQNRGRGKYEIEFLMKYMMFLNADAKGRMEYTVKKNVPMLNMDRMISMYSQYADTPDDLKYYIQHGSIMKK